MQIQLMVTGRMYHLAAELPERLDLPDGATIHDGIAAIQRFAGEAPLSNSSLVAVNGDHLGTIQQCADRILQNGDEITVVAPVAGG